MDHWLGGQACWGGWGASAGLGTLVTALAVWRLDSAAAGDGVVLVRIAMCFLLAASNDRTPEAKFAVYDFHFLQIAGILQCQ